MVDSVDIVHAVVMVDIVDVVDIDIVGIGIADTVEAIWNNAVIKTI